MKDAPEYLLGIVAQITEVLLSRINVPDKEIDKFSEQIRERHMGRLFENFETYDVQETRCIAREEGRVEARKEAREDAQKEGIRILIRTNKKHKITKEETRS